MHPLQIRNRRRRSAAAWCGLAALLLLSHCADYAHTHRATMTIWEVRVVKTEAEVAGCRFLATVDSRDAKLGCGSTVQPTPEECLRYQVRYAGGDTLLINGPIGKAYACSPEASAGEPAASAPAPVPTASTAPAPSSAAAPPPTPAPTAPPPRPTDVPSQTPAPTHPSVRVTAERSAAKGCVYVGDVPAAIPCGEGSPACVEEAARAGGNLVIVTSAGAQIFSCPARP